MKPHILFMCVANCVRSQMAEGLARSIFGDGAIVESAGSHPAGYVHPSAIAVMSEIGIDISGYSSKRVGDLRPEFLDNLAVLITLCADEVCPAFLIRARPDLEHLRWPLPDPVRTSGELDHFRAVRNTLRERLQAFRMERLT